uniref:Uncharacterized protein n=1 Tax=Ciona savignyi TaxID=51511 RepID=H2ZMT8_CIOSA
MEDTEIEIQISPMPNAPQPKSTQNKVHRNESIMGPTVQWFSSIEEANEAIKEHEIKLQCRYISKRKMAYDADRQLHIHWDQNYIPYILEGSSRLECQHGKNRFKAGTPKKQNENPKKAKKTYNCVKESIKRDCPAGITISEVCRFPLYKLGSIGKQRHRKREMAKFLRQLLQKKESINSESGCYVKFPTEGDHKGHVLGETIGNYQQHG